MRGAGRVLREPGGARVWVSFFRLREKTNKKLKTKLKKSSLSLHLQKKTNQINNTKTAAETPCSTTSSSARAREGSIASCC